MAIILDSDQPFTKGRSYPVSRIRGRKTITASVGAEQSEVWEQHQEPGGVINPHYHDVEETIVVLAGRASVTIGDDAPRELSRSVFALYPFRYRPQNRERRGYRYSLHRVLSENQSTDDIRGAMSISWRRHEPGSAGDDGVVPAGEHFQRVSPLDAVATHRSLR